MGLGLTSPPNRGPSTRMRYYSLGMQEHHRVLMAAPGLKITLCKHQLALCNNKDKCYMYDNLIGQNIVIVLFKHIGFPPYSNIKDFLKFLTYTVKTYCEIPQNSNVLCKIPHTFLFYCKIMHFFSFLALFMAVFCTKLCGILFQCNIIIIIITNL